MKTFKNIALALALLIIAILVVLLVRGSEDTWICEDGQWLKHGNPSSPMPDKPCGDILVEQPKPDQIVSSPLLIKGQARGNWYFEADFPVRLEDEAGNILSQTPAQAKDDWMSEDFVPFEAELIFEVATLTQANLILQKDNPSGLPEYDKQISIPLTLKPAEKMTVKVFFNNDQLDPEVTCIKVFPVKRQIPKTQAVGRAALEELLRGPTEEEKSSGYFTSINKGVKIQSLTIEQGTAKVDFDQQLEFQVGGSCRVAAIRHQITETLKQFPTVDEVIISIDGRTEDILQP